ncbi:MAG: phosphohydrolase [Patescibacteria group bacterium]|jgi:predicted hydrolase (HD superfamily)
MYDREKYIAAIKTELAENIVKHSLALEACMGALYDYLSTQGQLTPADEARDEWMLSGIIHDIDFSESYKETHPLKTLEVLTKHNLTIPESVDQIVKAHAPERTGKQPVTKAQWALFCADSLTGLIIAVALILPTKKLADVKLSSVMKRFLKDPRFAAGTRREEVAMCEKPEGLNIKLETFIDICLKAMQGIASDIGY